MARDITKVELRVELRVWCLTPYRTYVARHSGQSLTLVDVQSPSGDYCGCARKASSDRAASIRRNCIITALCQLTHSVRNRMTRASSVGGLRSGDALNVRPPSN